MSSPFRRTRRSLVDRRSTVSAARDLDLKAIAAALGRRDPVLTDPPDEPRCHAAVALVLAPGERGADLLFIERAKRIGDHWSGDMAFPGGRREAADASIEATVRREVSEEVGVTLDAAVARLDDFDARRGRRPWPLVVSPFVFTLPERPPLALNYEVAGVVWAPLAELLDPRAAVRHSYRGASVTVPGLAVEGRVVWGMTLRMLESFLAPLGLVLPESHR